MDNDMQEENNNEVIQSNDENNNNISDNLETNDNVEVNDNVESNETLEPAQNQEKNNAEPAVDKGQENQAQVKAEEAEQSADKEDDREKDKNDAEENDGQLEEKEKNEAEEVEENDIDAKSDSGRALTQATVNYVKSDEDDNHTEGSTTITKTGPRSPAPTPATQATRDNRKHTTTPADDSGLAQPVLPSINPRGQGHVQQISTAISHATRHAHVIHPIRARVPPKLVRLATVTVSPAKSRPALQGPSLYYEEPRRPQKVITWEEANNARPPLRIDMEGPGPCSYSPTIKPLSETNAPSYTFGSKCYPEKTGGARTSWSKSWFQSNHLWHSKADYNREGLWPSPTHYPKATLIGPRQRTMTEAPSYTFGHRTEFSIVRKGAHKEPSPTDYERQNADRIVLKRAPSFTHQFRREGTVLWSGSESSPGPCAYNPLKSPRHQQPAFTIQGIRREKSHVLGPYSSL